MNERIRELALQAGYLPDMFGIGHWDMPECQKFAELIVRECIGCCEQVISDPVPESVDTWLNGGTQCMAEIKQHFGVEESKGWVCPKCGTDRTKQECPKGYTAALTGDCPMVGTAQ